MADWKDFYEDNKEFFGQYLDSLAERRSAKHKDKSLPHLRFNSARCVTPLL